MNSFDNAAQALELIITDLHDEAMRVADLYWARVAEHEKQMTGFDNRSQLELSVTRRGNNLQLKWEMVRWYGPKADRRRIRTPIRRDAETKCYNDSALKSVAREWEWPIVREAEMQLASIRRQAHHIVRAIMSLRNANQVRNATTRKLKGLIAEANL